MGEKFPYFYYDIIARIIPGAMVLVTLWLAGTQLPFPSDDGIDSVIVGTVYLGACYAIGVCFEMLQGVRLVRDRMENILDDSFEAVLWSRKWRRPPSPSASELEDSTPTLRRHCWNWIVHQRKGGVPQAFAHAHRFSAETKMFLFTAFAAFALPIAIPLGLIQGSNPLMLLSILIAIPLGLIQGSISLMLLSILISGLIGMAGVMAYASRERRRWLAVLDALDELHSASGKDGSAQLAARCYSMQATLSEPLTGWAYMKQFWICFFLKKPLIADKNSAQHPISQPLAEHRAASFQQDSI